MDIRTAMKDLIPPQTRQSFRLSGVGFVSIVEQKIKMVLIVASVAERQLIRDLSKSEDA